MKTIIDKTLFVNTASILIRRYINVVYIYQNFDEFNFKNSRHIDLRIYDPKNIRFKCPFFLKLIYLGYEVNK